MSAGFQVFDVQGNVMLDSDDLTFRYLTSYNYTSPVNTDLIISAPGMVPNRFFAATMDQAAGFPIVENNQIRVKRAFSGGGGPSTLYVYSI